MLKLFVLNVIKNEKEIIKSNIKKINCILSVNIEALKPPYKVYKSELRITMNAVIHKSAPEI